jgi:broad specificity phosphatase PhoE
MKTTLLLIRHGETEWTRKKRYCGSNDVPLNATGKKQAVRLRKKLNLPDIDSVYCSDLKRARGFAAIALGGKKITAHRGLREMNFGIFEGLTYAQLKKKFPVLYSTWLTKFGSVTPPRAERFNVFRTRVLKTFREIIRKNRGKTCAIVSHGGVIMVMLAEIIGRDKVWSFLPALGSMNTIEINGKQKKWVI